MAPRRSNSAQRARRHRDRARRGIVVLRVEVDPIVVGERLADLGLVTPNDGEIGTADLTAGIEKLLASL